MAGSLRGEVRTAKQKQLTSLPQRQTRRSTSSLALVTTSGPHSEVNGLETEDDIFHESP